MAQSKIPAGIKLSDKVFFQQFAKVYEWDVQNPNTNNKFAATQAFQHLLETTLERTLGAAKVGGQMLLVMGKVDSKYGASSGMYGINGVKVNKLLSPKNKHPNLNSKKA